MDEICALIENANLRHVPTNNAAILDFTLGSEMQNSLAFAESSEGIEKADLLLVVFQELLRRYTGQASVTICVHHGSAKSSSATLDGNPPLRLLVQRPGHVSDFSNVADRQTRAADGQFSFVAAGGLAADREPQALISSTHLSFRCGESSLSGSLQFDPKIWRLEAVEGLLRSYQNLLLSALANLDAPVGQLHILTNSETEQLDAWNQTAAVYPRYRVDQLFEDRVADLPEHPAVTFAGRSLTYAELSEASNRLADRLRAIGVGPGTLAAICLDRGIEMVVALLAVFKTGGAFIPLDPAFPPDRIAFMNEDAQPFVMLTQSHWRERFSFRASHVLALDVESEEAGRRPEFVAEGSPSKESSANDLAYVLYTSGSTGKPKGVEITHGALTNLLSSVTASLALRRSGVFLATTTISFDIALFEIFAPLISGAHLVVASRTVATNGELLADAIRTSGATVLQATPSGWRLLLEAGWEGKPGLTMLSAGEPLDRKVANELLERGAELWNLYGPTEATIYATGCRVAKGVGKITVGKPLTNYQAYVLDHNRKRLPVGAIGELYLGGIGVARGYLNRPELTRERFMEDPFSAHGNLYKTGDLCRFLPDGEIELLGRADNQVKLRGYRIELGEIEALLDSHPHVRKSLAKVVDFGENDQRLAAYIVPRDAANVNERQLRGFAERSLPSYMVPSAYATLQAFPLTANGKVDRKALPAPPRQKLHCTEVLETHLDGLELALLCCCRSVLNLPNFGLDDNFFEGGGHSLLASRLFSEIADKLGRKLPVSLLAEAPTPRLLAARIREIQQGRAKCLVPMQTTGSLPPLYFIHHLFGDILIYRSLANQFASERQVFGIHPPVDLTERHSPSIQAIAAEYVTEILQRQPDGPFHLAGFSSGSVLAFEMARQLRQAGHDVGLLALIDGDINAAAPPMSRPLKYLKIIHRKLCKIAFKFRDEAREGPKQFVAKRLRYLLFRWQIGRLKRTPSAADNKISLEQTLTLAENAYRPEPYDGSILLLRFHDEAWQFGPDPLMGWGRLALGGIAVVDVPGGHITGMSPAGAPRLAGILKTQILKAETAPTRKRRPLMAQAAAQ